jgi:hypothetical protein
MAKPKGGKRPGSGRPRGTKNPSTFTKEAAREALRQTVLTHMHGMVAAQIAHSKGIGHLYTRDKTGKFSKIENQAEIDRLLSEGEAERDYWIFSKDPSVQAFTDLMNRAIDKPAEHVEVMGSGGGPLVIQWLP